MIWIAISALVAISSAPVWTSAGPDGQDRSRIGEMQFSCKSESVGGITSFQFVKTQELNAHGFYSTSLSDVQKWFYAKDSVVIYQNGNADNPMRMKISANSKSDQISYVFDLIYSGNSNGTDIWNFELTSGGERLTGNCERIRVMIPLSEKFK